MKDNQNQTPNQTGQEVASNEAALRLQYMPTDPSLASMAYFHEGNAEIVGFLGAHAKDPDSWAKVLNLSSIGFTLASGVAFMNPVRVLAAVSGYIGMGCYVLFPLNQGKLEGETLAEKFPKNLLRPDNNRDFSRYSWAFITSALTLLSGIVSGRPEEITRGTIRLGATGSQLYGLNEKDKDIKALEAKQAEKSQAVTSAQEPVIMESSESKPVAVVQHNGRSWNPFKGLKRTEIVGFSLSMLVATLSMVEGVRHDDRNMFMGGAAWLAGLGIEMLNRGHKYQKKMDELKNGNGKEVPAR